MTEWIKWKRGGKWVDNDEGYHYSWCHHCNARSEHDFNGCVECANRAVAARSGKKTRKVGDYTITRYPGGRIYCTCKGFKFRKTCKHLKTVSF